MPMNEQHMSPDHSPTGVRRVNNLPIYLIGGAVLAFLVVMMLVAAERANQQNKGEEPVKENALDSNKFADKIAGSQNGGLVPALEPPKVEPPKPEPAVTIARADNLNAPPMPLGGLNQAHNPGNDEALRIRQMKLQQLQEAIKAKTGMQIQSPRSPGSAFGGVTTNSQSYQTMAGRSVSGNADPTEVYKAKLAKLQQSGLIPGTDGQGDYGDNSSAPQLMKTGASSGNSNNYDQFGNSGQRDRWKLKITF